MFIMEYTCFYADDFNKSLNKCDQKSMEHKWFISFWVKNPSTIICVRLTLNCINQHLHMIEINNSLISSEI